MCELPFPLSVTLRGVDKLSYGAKQISFIPSENDVGEKA